MMSLINVDNVNKSTDRPTLKQAEAATICRIRAALTAAAETVHAARHLPPSPSL